MGQNRAFDIRVAFGDHRAMQNQEHGVYGSFGIQRGIDIAQKSRHHGVRNHPRWRRGVACSGDDLPFLGVGNLQKPVNHRAVAAKREEIVAAHDTKVGQRRAFRHKAMGFVKQACQQYAH